MAPCRKCSRAKGAVLADRTRVMEASEIDDAENADAGCSVGLRKEPGKCDPELEVDMIAH